MLNWIWLFLTLSSFLATQPTKQTIVFDFGGVMTLGHRRDHLLPFLCDSLNLSEAEFAEIYEQKREAARAGLADVEFWQQAAQKRGITLADDWSSIFHQNFIEAIKINSEMYSLVEQLKEKNYKVGMLSNVYEPVAHLLRRLSCYDPFSPCLLSYELGIEKPAKEIFEILLKELNQPAHEIVFIDDKVENIEAAYKLGIDAILFQSVEQIREELAKRHLL